jgi:hypothetical protein
MLAQIALAAIFVAAFAGAAFAQADKRQSGVGYPSVAAALEAVKAKPGVRVSVQDGWTVIAEQGGLVLGTFTPPGHPAHPTVARREAKQHANAAWYVDQRVLCQAAKAACDKINAEFVELNNQMRRAIERDGPRPDRVPPARAK